MISIDTLIKILLFRQHDTTVLMRRGRDVRESLTLADTHVVVVCHVLFGSAGNSIMVMGQ